ncbi:MAG: tetratricopeptide repeat protein [Anaerolineales bacterium]
MSTPLLATKLFIPPPRASLVSRRRLVERLNAGLTDKMTLISAPAGFGKTTLLSEWIHHPEEAPERHTAWVSLDEGDNDPARFLAYFTAAMETIHNGAPENLSDELAALKGASMEDFLTTLINEIIAISGGVLVVLDDYHLIQAQAVHETVAFLLDHQPPQLHLVIATRADPPLPIARLRAQGQVNEFRLNDLRFTRAEAAEFLNQLTGLTLSPEDVAALVSRTEGWIAGLQMAAVSMRGREDVSDFIRAYTGGHRHVLDYLMEEVFQRQPQGVQTFLLQTAILDRLTGPLCDAVLGGEIEVPKIATGPAALKTQPRGTSPSQEVLEYLDRSNLFIVPLDSERRWYRYHRLMTDLLRKLLGQTSPEGITDLHQRASSWFEKQGLTEEAINHALAAEDYPRAARLIDRVAEATLMRSEITTLLRWVEKLPDELVLTLPSLCIYHAWTLLMSGHPLEQVEARLICVDESSNLVRGRANALRAFVSAFQGQMSTAFALTNEALEQLPEEDLFLRGIATWNQAFYYLLKGEVAEGITALEESFRMGQQIGNPALSVMALSNLAEIHMYQGKLFKAKEQFQQALKLGVDSSGHPLPIAGMAMLGLGELYRQWNDFETAERYLIDGIERIENWGEVGAMDGYIFLAQIRQAQGDIEGAQAAMQKARRLAVQFDATEWDDFIVDMAHARLWIHQGEIEIVERWIETQISPDGSLPEPSRDEDSLIDFHMQKRLHIVQARVLLAQGCPDEALKLLLPLPPFLEQWGRVTRSIETLNITALAYQEQGDIDQAMITLERALSLAEPGGYMRSFLDEGPAMFKLLHHAASRGIYPEYVSRLISAFDAEMDTRSEPRQPLIDPLSERELEVLHLLARGLSNPEIAQELVIAVSTVRSHLKSIYSKLHVHRRWDAVQRSKELGLL